MTRLERLSQRWDSDIPGQARLQKFLGSASWDTLRPLLLELSIPGNPQPVQPHTNPDQIALQVHYQLLGFKKCLDTLELLSSGIPKLPEQEQGPWEHVE